MKEYIRFGYGGLPQDYSREDIIKSFLSKDEYYILIKCLENNLNDINSLELYIKLKKLYE